MFDFLIRIQTVLKSAMRDRYLNNSVAILRRNIKLRCDFTNKSTKLSAVSMIRFIVGFIFLITLSVSRNLSSTINDYQ